MFVCIMLLLLLHQIDFSYDDEDHRDDERDTLHYFLFRWISYTLFRRDESANLVHHGQRYCFCAITTVVHYDFWYFTMIPRHYVSYCMKRDTYRLRRLWLRKSRNLIPRGIFVSHNDNNNSIFYNASLARNPIRPLNWHLFRVTYTDYKSSSFKRY